MYNNSRLGSIEWIAFALVVIGALNWGLVGLAGFIGGNLNLVNLVLGGVPTIESIVYLVVGLAGLYLVIFGARSARASTHEPATGMSEAEAAK